MAHRGNDDERALLRRQNQLKKLHLDLAAEGGRRADELGATLEGRELLQWLLSSPLYAWLREASSPADQVMAAKSEPERAAVRALATFEGRAIASLRRGSDRDFWTEYELKMEFGRHHELGAEFESEHGTDAASARTPLKRGRAATLLTAATMVFDSVLEWGKVPDSGDRRRLAYECAFWTVSGFEGRGPEVRRRGADAAKYVRDVVKDAAGVRDVRFEFALEAWEVWEHWNPPDAVVPEAFAAKSRALILVRLTDAADAQTTASELKRNVPEITTCHQSAREAHLVLQVAASSLDDVAARVTRTKGVASVQLVPLTRDLSRVVRRSAR